MPTHAQLERRVIDIADRVKRRVPIEDSLVELKREWPEHTDKKRYEFSRQIAGHANSAGGSPILWIIGIHDKSATVPGATDDELSTWLAIFKSHFDGLAPDLLINLVVPVGDVSVVALRFDTSRAPYVLKYPRLSEPTREVPWREGNAARTATREDLMRVLAPVEAVPDIEPRECIVSEGGRHDALQLSLRFEMYVHSATGEKVTFPLYKCKAAIGNTRADGKIRWVPMSVARITASPHHTTKPGYGHIESKTVIESASETIVSGAGMVTMYARIDAKLGKLRKTVEADVSLWVLGAGRAVRLRETLSRDTHPRTGEVQWVMKRRADASLE
ncbi:hypothetical protein WME75_14000 [Sorangium sp. So ce1014]|uniref:hypothetical protein n=1 Tax=Sorangium sp. So ce1014 TaxID=3133326 RepID=UPI003F61893E